MSGSVRLDSEALNEIIRAARYYDERERGRGDRFSEAVFGRLERLNSFPNAGSPVWGVNGVLPARQVRLRKYPYLIVDAVSDDHASDTSVHRVALSPMGASRARHGSQTPMSGTGSRGDARFVRVARGLGNLSILLGLAAVVSWAIMVIAVMPMGGARLATQGPIDRAGGAHGDGQAVVGA